MASFEIIPLRCPSCGAVSSNPPRELSFGAEFRCSHCQATSLLVINRNLVLTEALLKSGEKVCASCGQVVLKEARFCQQGHSLVRSCLCCHQEFPAQHQRCDFCGRLQVEVQLEGALQRVETLAGTRIPEANLPVRGLTADQLWAEIRGIQQRIRDTARVSKLVKVLLIVLAVVPCFFKIFVQVLFLFVGWQLYAMVVRRKVVALGKRDALHRQAVAGVERNARIDLELSAAQAEVALLREQLV